jgi:hypothetical protein
MDRMRRDADVPAKAREDHRASGVFDDLRILRGTDDQELTVGREVAIAEVRTQQIGV